jgi:hypothetical protein
MELFSGVAVAGWIPHKICSPILVVSDTWVYIAFFVGGSGKVWYPDHILSCLCYCVGVHFYRPAND